MKVLIVDDEPFMVDYLETLVEWEKLGYDEVITAKGGSMARKILEEQKVDLLVTDIKMPRVSGIDLSQYIDEQQLDTKVIIVSGYSDFEYAKSAMHYGVAEYLVKPVLQEDLLACLDRLNERCFADRIGETGAEEEPQDEIAVVKHYVAVHCGEDISLDILSDLVHWNPAYLSRSFKDRTGENLSSYIAKTRMCRAAELLEQSDLKIHDIMLRVGYQKDQYFAKVFKEQHGVTPKEYRKLKRKLGN
ncbi:MAG: response regulator [Lachnospiraceae bacterium]|nr:response regulator [Lachnospiraceae bacterium]